MKTFIVCIPHLKSYAKLADKKIAESRQFLPLWRSCSPKSVMTATRREVTLWVIKMIAYVKEALLGCGYSPYTNNSSLCYLLLSVWQLNKRKATYKEGQTKENFDLLHKVNIWCIQNLWAIVERPPSVPERRLLLFQIGYAHLFMNILLRKFLPHNVWRIRFTSAWRSKKDTSGKIFYAKSNRTAAMTINRLFTNTKNLSFYGMQSFVVSIIWLQGFPRALI